MLQATLNASLFLLASSLPVFAGTAVFKATGTVATATAPSGPFAGTTVGQSVQLVFEVFTPGTDLVPGQYTNYAIDLPTLQVTIGPNSTGSNGVASAAGMVNNFPVADGIHVVGAPLAGGQKLDFEFSECSGAIFSSTDPLQNIGSWSAALFCSYNFSVYGAGVFIDITPLTFEISLTNVGSPICFGDGSQAVLCPCSNSGLAAHGCDNSAATGGALLTAVGTASPDTIVLSSSGELATVLSIFLQGNTTLAVPVSFGDGLRCLGGSLKRLYVKNAVGGLVSAPVAGDPSITAQSAALGEPIAPGSARHYQTYYRDPNLAFCAPPAGNSWNVSSGLTINW